MADQIGIKVWPDARGFRSDLKKSLERVEKQLKVNIPATVSISRAGLADLRRQLKTLKVDIPAGLDTSKIREAAEDAKETVERTTRRAPAEIPVAVADIDRRFISRLQSEAKRAAESVEAQIPATIEGEGMRKNLRWQLDRIERQMQATIPVEPEKAAAWRAELNRMVDEINDQKAEIEANVDVDHAAASAQVAAFTRPRFLPVHISINKSSLLAATTAIAALSGARAVADRVRSLGTSLMNLDRSVPRIAGVSSALLSLSSAALAGLSNILVLGSGLSQIASLGLVLPGLFAGFGVGLGVMIAALADAGDVLSDIGPQFSALQDTISSNFWAKAEEPIRNLVNTWLPSLERGFGSVATELGTFFGSLSTALSSTDNIGHLDSILANIRDSIDIAGEGVAHFADAMMGLVDVGASYLPSLASWFNRISESFSGWIETNTANGNMFRWIDQGITALQDLGRVVWGIGGMFSNITRAAAAAGGSTLGSLADGLENMNRALEGPAWQGALTTVFEGAHNAMAALGPGVGALADAFRDFAPTLAEIMVLAGEIGSVGLTAIADAFSNPAFQGGLTDFFEGVLAGVEAVAPYIPALAEAFGAVASFAGTLASILGPVLGAAIGALAPVVVDLMQGLEPVAQVLGDVLVGAIETVAPYIQDLVEKISTWVQENPVLAATIGAVVAGIGLLIAAAIGIVTALAPVIGAVLGAVSAAAGLGLSFSGVAAAIGAFLGPVALVVAAIAAIVGAFVYAWQTSETFRNAIAGLGVAIMGFLAPIIEFVMGTVVPVVAQVAGAFMAMVQQILDALVPFWTVMVQIWTEIINILTPVIAFVLDVFAPIFTHLGNIVSAAFTFIGTVISSAINIITAILQVFLAVLRGDWSAAWEAIKNVGVVIWDSIKAVIGAAIAFVVTTIQSWLATAQSVWNTVWGAISSFVSSIWSSIVSAITGFISGLVAAIVTFVSTVHSRIQSGFEAARAAAVEAFQRLVSGVIDKIGTLLSEVKALPGKITSGLGNLGSLLYSAGQDVIRGLVNGIKNMASSAVDAAKGVVGDAVSGAKNLLGINSPSRVFMEIGEFTGEGMIIGLEHKARGVSAAMGSMVEPPALPTVGTAGGPGEPDIADLSDIVAAIAGWQPMVQLGDREFFGAVVDVGKSNRRPFVTKPA